MATACCPHTCLMEKNESKKGSRDEAYANIEEPIALQPARQEKTARHGQSPAHGCKSLHCYCSMATILSTNDILPDCDKHDLRCPLSWTYDLSHGQLPCCSMRCGKSCWSEHGSNELVK